MNNKKIYEPATSKIKYSVMILRSIFSIVFIKQILILFAYYIFNYIRGCRIAKIGKRCHISPTVLMRYPERIIIGDDCLLNHNNVLQAGKKDALIKLGNYVMCGPNVQMFAYNHGMDLIDTPMIKQPYTENDIIIEDNVWIGAGSIILAGTIIRSGVVVAAGSVVKGELPPNTICGGVPAKVIKERT
ncbi:MAG: acyltransferase [Planctomycetaceae bacterium]|nr:acyltransferase [Planctomycetaceae bacterium]